MPEDDLPPPHQNPHHPFDETEQYRAFRNGSLARCRRKPRTANPHDLSDVQQALAWLDGWTAAQERDRDPDTNPGQIRALHRSAIRDDAKTDRAAETTPDAREAAPVS